MRWLYLLSILAVIILVLGVEQCPMPQGGSSFGGGNQQTKSGISVSLVSGVGYFSQGMTFNQGDTFKIILNVENYDKTEKKGTICVKDNQDDAYGGIPISGECSQFALAGATYQNEKFIASSVQRIVFPINGEDFRYYDLPMDANAQIFVSYSYVQHSTAQASINVPSPEQETVSLTQPSSPITLSVDKTISKQLEQYKTSLGITLSSQADTDTKIYSDDMKSENFIKFTARLSPSSGFSGYPLDCTQTNPGTINIDIIKFIKCTTFLPLEVTSYPLLVYTDYGVKVTKTFDFKIMKEEK
jgi:hypothetical protein